MRALACAAVLMLASCDRPGRDAASYAADPAAARGTVAACEAGRQEPDCQAAREGLAEARRRERMVAYEQAF